MKKVIATKSAPAAVGPYSQAMKFGGFVFCSGQIGLSIDGNLAESFEKQTHQIFENLKNVLAAADSDFSKVLKVSVFLTEIERFAEFNEIYAANFSGENLPAREVVAVKSLPKNAAVEVSLIAAA